MPALASDQAYPLSSDNVHTTWSEFTKYKNTKAELTRLENISWRIWHALRLSAQRGVVPPRFAVRVDSSTTCFVGDDAMPDASVNDGDDEELGNYHPAAGVAADGASHAPSPALDLRSSEAVAVPTPDQMAPEDAALDPAVRAQRQRAEHRALWEQWAREQHARQGQWVPHPLPGRTARGPPHHHHLHDSRSVSPADRPHKRLAALGRRGKDMMTAAEVRARKSSLRTPRLSVSEIVPIPVVDSTSRDRDVAPKASEGAGSSALMLRSAQIQQNLPPKQPPEQWQAPRPAPPGKRPLIVITLPSVLLNPPSPRRGAGWRSRAGTRGSGAASPTGPGAGLKRTGRHVDLARFFSAAVAVASRQQQPHTIAAAASAAAMASGPRVLTYPAQAPVVFLIGGGDGSSDDDGCGSDSCDEDHAAGPGGRASFDELRSSIYF